MRWRLFRYNRKDAVLKSPPPATGEDLGGGERSGEPILGPDRRSTPHPGPPPQGGREINRSNRSARLLLKPLLTALLLATVPAAAADLASPFALIDRTDRPAATDAKPCPAPIAPVPLDFSGFYKPGTSSSEVDAEAMRKYRAATAPIAAYENAITRMSDAYLSAAERDAALAGCVLDWLYAWAAQGAMLTAESHQGEFLRKWGLAPVAATYIKIRHATGLDDAKNAAVRKWIADWAHIVRDDYDSHTARSSRRNNHLNWAALSVTWAGVATDDRALFDWGLAKYRIALEQIAKDGTLPLEIDRKSKARHYHLFALQPLVFIAETAARNGVDLYTEDSGALQRLVARVVASLDDPSYFARLTGQKQAWIGKLNGGKLTWMEPYYARFADARLRPWLDRFRPLKNRRTGGNATLLYSPDPFGKQR
jgi:poly(beta-D-mannuronate) lyase